MSVGRLEPPHNHAVDGSGELSARTRCEHMRY